MAFGIDSPGFNTVLAVLFFDILFFRN
jgi:hypothetical protein